MTRKIMIKGDNMIKQNLHTHSIYCDGKDTIDEMVQEAIHRDFTILGFSGHGFCKIDNCSMSLDKMEKYVQDVFVAKERYKAQIDIYLGIEQDLIGKRFEKGKPFDYIIGSVHFVPIEDHFLPVDLDKKTMQRLVEYYGSFLEFAKVYYEETKKLALMDEVDIVGHIDLLTKFNEDGSFIAFDDPDYLKLAQECIDVLVKANKIFEINTGAIARGYRKTPYPHKLLLEYLYQKGGRICLNSDCHDRFKLDCDYQGSLRLIRSCGFEKMMVFDGNGFVESGIDEFAY